MQNQACAFAYKHTLLVNSSFNFSLPTLQFFSSRINDVDIQRLYAFCLSGSNLILVSDHPLYSLLCKKIDSLSSPDRDFVKKCVYESLRRYYSKQDLLMDFHFYSNNEWFDVDSTDNSVYNVNLIRELLPYVPFNFCRSDFSSIFFFSELLPIDLLPMLSKMLYSDHFPLKETAIHCLISDRRVNVQQRSHADLMEFKRAIIDDKFDLRPSMTDAYYMTLDRFGSHAVVINATHRKEWVMKNGYPRRRLNDDELFTLDPVYFSLYRDCNPLDPLLTLRRLSYIENVPFESPDFDLLSSRYHRYFAEANKALYDMDDYFDSRYLEELSRFFANIPDPSTRLFEYREDGDVFRGLDVSYFKNRVSEKLRFKVDVFLFLHSENERNIKDGFFINVECSDFMWSISPTRVHSAFSIYDGIASDIKHNTWIYDSLNEHLEEHTDCSIDLDFGFLLSYSPPVINWDFPDNFINGESVTYESYKEDHHKKNQWSKDVERELTEKEFCFLERMFNWTLKDRASDYLDSLRSGSYFDFRHSGDPGAVEGPIRTVIRKSLSTDKNRRDSLKRFGTLLSLHKKGVVFESNFEVYMGSVLGAHSMIEEGVDVAWFRYAIKMLSQFFGLCYIEGKLKIVPLMAILLDNQVFPAVRDFLWDCVYDLSFPEVNPADLLAHGLERESESLVFESFSSEDLSSFSVAIQTQLRDLWNLDLMKSKMISNVVLLTGMFFSSGFYSELSEGVKEWISSFCSVAKSMKGSFDVLKLLAETLLEFIANAKRAFETGKISEFFGRPQHVVLLEKAESLLATFKDYLKNFDVEFDRVKHLEECNDVLKKLGSLADKGHSQSLREILSRLVHLRDCLVEMGEAMRDPPLGIIFAGPPGIGKTTLIEKLHKISERIYGLPEDSAGLFLYDFGVKHQNPPPNVFGLIFNDVGDVVDEALTVPLVPLFQRAVDSSLFSLERAEIEDKRQANVNPRLVYATTNCEKFMCTRGKGAHKLNRRYTLVTMNWSSLAISEAKKFNIPVEEYFERACDNHKNNGLVRFTCGYMSNEHDVIHFKINASLPFVRFNTEQGFLSYFATKLSDHREKIEKRHLWNDREILGHDINGGCCLHGILWQDHMFNSEVDPKERCRCWDISINDSITSEFFKAQIAANTPVTEGFREMVRDSPYLPVIDNVFRESAVTWTDQLKLWIKNLSFCTFLLFSVVSYSVTFYPLLVLFTLFPKQFQTIYRDAVKKSTEIGFCVHLFSLFTFTIFSPVTGGVLWILLRINFENDPYSYINLQYFFYRLSFVTEKIPLLSRLGFRKPFFLDGVIKAGLTLSTILIFYKMVKVSRDRITEGNIHGVPTNTTFKEEYKSNSSSKNFFPYGSAIPDSDLQEVKIYTFDMKAYISGTFISHGIVLTMSHFILDNNLRDGDILHVCYGSEKVSFLFCPENYERLKDGRDLLCLYLPNPPKFGGRDLLAPRRGSFPSKDLKVSKKDVHFEKIEENDVISYNPIVLLPGECGKAGYNSKGEIEWLHGGRFSNNSRSFATRVYLEDLIAFRRVKKGNLVTEGFSTELIDPKISHRIKSGVNRNGVISGFNKYRPDEPLRACHVGHYSHFSSKMTGNETRMAKYFIHEKLVNPHVGKPIRGLDGEFHNVATKFYRSSPKPGTGVFNPKIMDLALQCVLHGFRNIPKCSPLSRHEMFAGNPKNCYVNPRDPEKSIGMLLREYGLSNEETVKQVDDFHYTPDPRLMEEILKVESDIEGPIRPTVVSMTLKDEMIAEEKLTKGGGRFFGVLGYEFNVVLKKMLNDIIAFALDAAKETHMYAGIVASSKEWKELYDYLSQKNTIKKLLEFDHKSFDSHHSYLLPYYFKFIDALCKMAGYSDYDREFTVRQIKRAFYNLNFVDGDVVLTFARLASGRFDTLFCNSFFNLLLVYYAFITFLLSEGEDISNLTPEKIVAMIFVATVGDDLLISTLEKYSGFTGKVFSEIVNLLGYEVTSAGEKKELKDHILFSEASFLKRGFRVVYKDDGSYDVYGPLTEKSINKSLCYFTACKVSEDERNIAAIENAQREFFLHGLDKFNSFQSHLRSVEIYLPKFKYLSFSVLQDTYDAGLLRVWEPGVDQITELGNPDIVSPLIGDINGEKIIFESCSLSQKAITIAIYEHKRSRDGEVSCGYQTLAALNASTNFIAEVGNSPIVELASNDMEVSSETPIMRPVRSVEPLPQSDLAEFLKRPRYIGHILFGTSTSWDLGTSSVLEVWKAIPAVAKKLSGYSYFRGDLRLSVRFAGAPTLTGTLIMYAFPVIRRSDIEGRPAGIKPNWMSSGVDGGVYTSQGYLLPHVQINIEQKQDLDLVLPFCDINDFKIINGANANSLRSSDYMLGLSIVNDMQASSGYTPSSVEIMVFASYENVELMGLIYESKKKDEVSVSGTLNYASEVLSKIGGYVPFVNPMARVAKLGGTVASMLGFSRPLEQTTSNTFFSTISNFAMTRSAPSFAMLSGGTVESALDTTSTRFPFGNEKDTDIDYVCGRKSLVRANVKTVNNFFIVHPTVCPLVPASNDFTSPLLFTSMAFVAVMFTNWTGSIDVEIEFACNALVRGRYMINVFPPGSTNPGTAVLNGSVQSYEVEVVGRTVFRFTVPYLGLNGFTAIVPPETCTSTGNMNLCPFFTVNELEVYGMSHIPYNVFYFSEDVSFALPTTEGIQAYLAGPGGTAEGYVTEGSNSKELALHTFGDVDINLLPLTRQPGQNFTFSLGANNIVGFPFYGWKPTGGMGFGVAPTPPFGYGTISATNQSWTFGLWLSQMYVGMGGSVEWRIQNSDPTAIASRFTALIYPPAWTGTIAAKAINNLLYTGVYKVLAALTETVGISEFKFVSPTTRKFVPAFRYGGPNGSTAGSNPPVCVGLYFSHNTTSTNLAAFTNFGDDAVLHGLLCPPAVYRWTTYVPP